MTIDEYNKARDLMIKIERIQGRRTKDENSIMGHSIV